LEGTIPSEIGFLRKMTLLDLGKLFTLDRRDLGRKLIIFCFTMIASNNAINGTIPSELGNLESLLTFLLRKNQIFIVCGAEQRNLKLT
jgi:hypothetical protein